MYAVVPVKWCPHLEQVNPVPGSGLKTASPCEECQDPSENWVCLTCYKVRLSTSIIYANLSDKSVEA